MASKRSSRKAQSFIKRHPKLLAAILIILVLLIAAAAIVYFVRPDLFNMAVDRLRQEYLEYTQQYYEDSPLDDPEGTNGANAVIVPEGALADISTAEFSIHFIELGNEYTGDCTLIDCGDTEVLIDAGSRKSSATTINSYIEQYCADGKLEYVIATHAHQDHIAGFVGNASGDSRTGVLYNFEVGTIIQFSGHNTSSQIYKDYVAAAEYCADTYGTAVYDADDCWYNRNGASRSFALNQSGTLTLNVLYNYFYENKTSDENDYSVCTLLTYAPQGGEESHYLFTGDLEGDGEEHLVADNDLPEVVLFKGGHHGSKTSSTDKLLNIIKPQYVAVCCCSGSTEYTDNNDNTFPTQAFIDRISKHTDAVYCTSLADDSEAGFTSMNGNIVFYYQPETDEDGGLKLWCSNNTQKLKDTDWFKSHRVSSVWGWTEEDRSAFVASGK